MKKFVILGGVLLVIIIVGLGFLFGYIFTWSPEAQSRNKFIDNFELSLVGKVTNVKLNDYGQKLICLEVLQSNRTEYFPIHNPNNFNSENIWEERFFIKVENEVALFVYNDDRKYNKITANIKIGSIIKINENNNKSFRVYDSKGLHSFGGIKIITYPIRNSIDDESNWCF